MQEYYLAATISIIFLFSVALLIASWFSRRNEERMQAEIDNEKKRRKVRSIRSKLIAKHLETPER